MKEARIFDGGHYEQLNKARGDAAKRILADVRKKEQLTTAIDVGCGVGHFSALLSGIGFDVIGVDAREENVAEAARRFAHIKFVPANAESEALRQFGKFDLVFCFGLLYHLENPLLVVRHLKELTRRVALVESVTFPGEEPLMALIDEEVLEDQGLQHFAFYPTESCLIKMLFRAGFKHVYTLKTQPDHFAYRSGTGMRRTRTLLAAATEPLESAELVEVCEPHSDIKPWDPRSGSRAGVGLRRLANLGRFRTAL